jgi:hypothetical protein
MIKFEFKDDKNHIIYETKAGWAPDKVHDFRYFLLAIGFQPETVAEALPDAP